MLGANPNLHHNKAVFVYSNKRKVNIINIKESFGVSFLMQEILHHCRYWYIIEEKEGEGMASNNGKLTTNEEGYVQSRLQDVSQRQAYKDNYKCGKASDKNIDERACRLEKKPKVKARLDELRGKVIKQAEEEGIFTALDTLRGIADIIQATKKDDPKTALKGYELYGKYHKLFTDKIEHSGKIELPTIKITK